MNIIGKIQNIEEIELSLTITMTIKEWEDLGIILPQKYPFGKISSAITDAVLKVHTEINEEIKKDY